MKLKGNEAIEKYILINGFTIKEILENDEVDYDLLVKLEREENNIEITYSKDGNKFTYEIKQ